MMHQCYRLFGRIIKTAGGRFPALADRLVRLLVGLTNARFRRRFSRVPFAERILFLPACLRPRVCRAPVDPEMGLVCPQECAGCAIARLKAEAGRLGYGAVFVVASGRLKAGISRSREFMTAKVAQLRPRAAVGALCAADLRAKYLSAGVSGRGVEANGSRVVVQGILLDSNRCLNNTLDVPNLLRLLRLGKGSRRTSELPRGG